MSILIEKLAWLGSALNHDAKILIDDTQGKAAKNPKVMLMGAGAILFGVVAIGVLSTGNDANSKTAANDDVARKVTAEPTALTPAQMYDFRSLSEQELLGSETTRLILKSGQSLGPLLQKNGISPNTAYGVTQAFSKVYDPRDLRALSLDYLTGSGKARSYARAYYFALLAEAAGDIAAASLRDEITARFGARGPEVAQAWNALSAQVEQQAVTDWINADLPARYLVAE